MTDGTDSKRDGIRSRVERLTPEERTALEQRLLAKRRDVVSRTFIPPREPGAHVPLSFAQQRMWLLEQMAPGNAAHVIADAVLLESDLDVDVLRRSFEALVRRHESLRTTFRVVDGEPMQIVADVSRFELPVEDLAGAPDEALHTRARDQVAESLKQPIDLERGPILRATLHRTGNGRYLLLILVHHIASDAWSHELMKGELAQLYAAYAADAPSPLAPPALQYADFAVWQRETLQGAELDRQMAYWREQLAGVPNLEIPTDRPRPALPETHGRHESLVLPPELTGALRALCGSEEYTVYMVMLAAVGLLLHRYSGQDDIVVGSPIAGRNRSELEGVVGFFINMLVLRTDLAGDPTGRALLDRVRETILAANEHQDVPFEKLVDELHPARDLSRTPFFQVAYEYRRLETDAPETTGLPMRPVGFALDVTRFDLELHAWERGDDIGVQVVYRTDLFDASTIQRMLGHLTALLEGIVRSPDAPVSQLELLTADERRRLVHDWNETDRPFRDDRCLHEWFEEHAQRAPDSIALVFEDETLTYRELDRRANRLAHELRSRGVRPDALVGICADRGFDMVVGILGILKAGGAYVPLDPGYPAERLAFMLADSGVSILLTQTHLVETLPDHGAEVLCLDRDVAGDAEREAALPCVTTPENLAYVIYTSGSTGTPKGALLRHRGICNLSEEQAHAFGVGPGSRVLQFSSLSFDASTFDIVMALAKGATLYLGRRETLLPGPDLLGFLRRHAISIVTMPPSALAALPVESLPDLTTITVAGEACPEELVARWAPGRRFFNLYGPTEATIWSTMTELEKASGPPHIGRPIGNTRLYVLDERMRPVPVGVPGELYIAGAGLARGYHGRPALTAERFVPNPFSDVSGDRLYRSGDLVRYRADGNLDFLGRIDHQVKLRGFRIELGEIEATLARHPAVRETTVLCREDQPGEKQLVAYVVGAADGPPAAPELRRYLGDILPDYMVPAAFVHLDALPVTRNGKIDRAALPAPATDRADAATYLAPRSELEERIGAIWCEILGIEQVGVRDNFFELGGHSLRLVQMHTRLVETLGCPLSVTDLFQLPTVEMISERLRGTAGPATDLRRAAQVRVERCGHGPRDAIAVIGMSVRVPGAADVEAFWDNLRSGVESVRFYADETLREVGVPDAVLRNPSYVKAQPALDDVDLFDARYFGYTPREAEIMDPQHRVLLECAVEALERAGYDPDRYAGLIGVYAGSSSNEYRTNVRSNPDLAAAAAGLAGALGSNPDFLPTRVSYKLNLRGPSINIQTACSTSLVAVHYACEALVNQQCDMALVGGVAISVPNVGGYLFHDGGIVSPDGHCRTFDVRAQGTLRGDGAGLVVLKRLDEALRDGDDVHAVILGTAVNNDGSHKVGYTAPSIDGQAEVIAMAQAAAGVEPETITYVEAHGTATPLGDPIEVAALTRVFRERTDRTGYCGLGSLKSNMGHLDAAAGVTGLIKTVLALEHGELPPSLHYERPNPEIDFDASPFFVNTTLRPWTPDGFPRRAGVSSFGLGGTNAHVVLEQPPAMAPSDAVDGWQLLVLSAKTKSALAQARAELAEHLRANPSIDLADAAFTLQVGRRQLEHRLAVRGRDVEEAVAALEDGGADVVGTGHTAASARPVVFMFPGQGAQDVNMGRDLYDQYGVFREAVDACLAIVDEELRLGLRDVLYPEGDVTDAARARLKQTSMAQPALFTISYALARQWMAWGVQPESMIGHSIGEYVAACIAGVLDLDDALRLVVTRGRLMESMPAGVMTAVTASRKDVEAAMAGADDLWMSALNAPGLNVVSAHADRMEAFEARLAALGIEYRRLHTSHAFHSGMMDDAVTPFVEAVAGVPIGAPRIPYVSNVTGDWVTEADVCDAAYWGRHIREPVQFAAGMERLLADASRVLLEVGPGQVLAAMAKQQDGFDRDRTVVSSMRRVKSKTAAPAVPSVADTDDAHLAAAIGRLWMSGVDVDWPALHGAARRRRVTLPTYPFQRERYWAEGRVTPVAAPVAGRRANLADWFYTPVWRRTRIEASVEHPAADGGSILVFARDVPIDRRIVAGLEASGRPVVVVRPGRSFGGGDRAYEIDPTAAADYARLLGQVRETHGAPAEIIHLWTVSFAAQRPSGDDANEIQKHGLQSLLLLARGLAGAEITDAVRINVVTDGVHGVSGDEQIQPEKATMLGFCRTVPLEIPNVSCRSVDIAVDGDGGGEPDERDVDGLVGELCSTRSDTMVALRRGHRWVQSFVRVPLAAVPDEAAQRRLRPKGTYLITGGLGGIGLELAGMLARDVQARLVLTTRSPLPERGAWAAYVEDHDPGDPVVVRIRAIEAMEAAGAEVMVAEADVSDVDAMQRVTAEAQRRFGSINGVIHLAGVPGGEIIQATEPEAVARTLAPKVTGTRVLERLFGGAELDFLVLSSSLITSWSVPGFVDYSAANAFLDSFARRFAADTGTFTVAIDWPRWSEAGMAVDFARAHGVHTPIQGITNAEGVEVFRRVLGGCDEAQILVSEVDFRESLRRQAAATADRGRAQSPEDDTSDARARHARPEMSTPFLAPRDQNEEALARIWRNLFGIEEIGVHDNFFELGGDSVLSIQMAARAKEARIPLTTKNVMELPTIALLAATVDDAAPGAGAARESQQPVVGDVPLTPIQQWFLELDLVAPDHFNHAVLLQARCDLPRAQWEAVVRALLEHHDALRLRVIRQGGGWRQISAEPTESVPFTIIDLSGEPEGTRAAAIETHAAELQASLDLATGPIVRIALFDLGPDQPARLLVVAHHLAIDAVSWPIVLEDLARLVDQQIRGVEMELPAKTTSYQAWARRLHEHALSPAVAAEVSSWNDLPWSRVAPLPVDVPNTGNTVGESATVSVSLDEAETRRLLREVPQAYRTRIDEVLLAALVGAFESWTGSSTLLVDMEGHGREPLFDEVDLSRTVGWFTSMYPVVLDAGGERGPGATLKRVKEQVRSVPGRGIGYGLLRYLHPDPAIVEELRSRPAAEVSFLYFGQQAAARGDAAEGTLGPATEATGAGRSPRNHRAHLIEIMSGIGEGRLAVQWMYSTRVHRRETVEAIAERFIQSLREIIEHCSSGKATGHTPSDFPYATVSQDELDRIEARYAPDDIEDLLALSPMQRGMLFHRLQDPDSGMYMEQTRLRVDGLDAGAFRRAWERVVERHAALRTSIIDLDSAEPLQLVNRQVPLPFVEHDLRETPASDAEAWIDAFADAERHRVFGPDDASRMRLALIRVGDDAYEFVWTVEHLIIDGWSKTLLIGEVFGFYGREKDGIAYEPDEPRPYRDYIRWLHAQDPAEAAAYWQGTLGDVEAGTLVGRASTAEPGRDEPEIVERQGVVSEEITKQLKVLAAEMGVTLNTVVLAAWSLLLGRCVGTDDLVLGTPVTGRPPDLPGVESIVGLCLNTVPIRVRLDDEATLSSLLRTLHAQQIERSRFEYSPLWEVQRWSGVPAGTPLFDNLFLFQNYPVETSHVARSRGITVQPRKSIEHVNYPVMLAVHPGEQLLFRLTCDLAIVDADAMGRLLDHLATVLRGFASDPQQRLRDIALLDDEACEQIVVAWNRTTEALATDDCLHELFEMQASRTPDAVALTCGTSDLGYAELDRRASRLAHHLIERGAGPEHLVGICLPRGIDMVVAILGVLKAGAAYVPLDPAYPAERLAFIVEDAAAAIVLTHEALLAVLPEHAGDVICLDRDAVSIAACSAERPAPRARPGNLAYVIYTSGSTGRPKGTLITHGNAASLVHWVRTTYSDDELSGVLASTSMCFDLSIFEIFAPLSWGGSIILADDALATPSLAARDRVTLINTVPSAMAELVRQNAVPEAVRVVNLAGEPLTTSLADRVYEAGVERVFDLYGPSEDTTYSTCALREPGGAATIGRPLANKKAYILDRDLRPVPVGFLGELYVGGAGVARGYLNRPALTAERFIPNPFAKDGGTRLYRTGDLARYRADGCIEFCGRADHQIKLRGFRIELGEIESVLDQHPQIDRSVALVRAEHAGNRRLVAYLVPRTGASLKTSEVQAFLKERLPAYMVPSALVELESLPLTPNGKLDRRALPDFDPGASARTYEAPRNSIEQTLAEIWSTVLGVETVGVHDNFFELGGDSILSIQIIARANDAGLRLEPRQMFKYETVGELATVAGTESSGPLMLAEQEPVVGELPLTPIEHWFFDQELANAHHFNQSMLVSVRERLSCSVVEQVVEALLAHHDALRLRFERSETGWKQVNVEPGGSLPFEYVDLSAIAEAEQPAAIGAKADALQASLDLNEGPLVRVALFDLGEDRPGRLLIVVHHLAVDGVSWRILLENLQRACEQVIRGEEIRLPAKTTSYRQWSDRLTAHAASDEMQAELERWTDQPWGESGSIPVAGSVERNTAGLSRTQAIELTEEETRTLLQEVPRAYNTQIDDVLLTALVEAFAAWTGRESLLVDLEGHGREALFEDVDLSRTVGWFTAIYPVLLNGSDSDGQPLRGGAALKSIKEQLRRVPNRGVGYGLLRYLCDDDATSAKLAALPHPEVSFNYLGQFDQMVDEQSMFGFAGEPMGAMVSPRGLRNHLIDVVGVVTGGRLRIGFMWGSALHEEGEIEALAERYGAALVGLIAHCTAPDSGGCTPSDFPLTTVDQRTLDELVAEYGPREIEDLYPLSPMQLGMVYHSVSEPTLGLYVQQMRFDVEGLDAETFKRSWTTIVARHSVLRTTIVGVGSEMPLQLVHGHVELSATEHDLRELTEVEQKAWLETFQDEDRVRGFDLADPPLMRLAIIWRGDKRYELMWTFHHILLDGWSFPRVINEIFAVYEARRRNEDAELPRVRPFGKYIAWLQEQDAEKARTFWQRTLGGFATPTRLGEALGSVDAAGTTERYDHETRVLSAELTESLRRFASRHHVTMNTLVAGAWSLLLSRYSGTSDVVFGTIVSGRPADLDSVESMVGMFVNTLPLRVSIPGGQASAEWLRKLQEHQAELRQYEFSPLWQVQREADLPPGTPLFDSLYIFENYPVDVSAVEASDLTMSLTPPVERTGYPITLVAAVGSRAIFNVTYDCDRFEAGTIRRLLDHLQTLLHGMIDAPETRLGAVPMLSDAEREHVLSVGADEAASYTVDLRIHERFELHAAQSPDATALVFEDQRLTYEQLNARANRVAHYLRAQGVGPEVLVGLCVERSFDLVVGILGVLKAGGAYVPIDPGYPTQRLSFILDDSRTEFLLTQSHLAGDLPDDRGEIICLDAAPIAQQPETNPSRVGTPRDTAYVIYTSGSTGTPKGVLVQHDMVARLFSATEGWYGFDERDVWTLFHSYAFDFSVWELWGALLYGGRLVVVPYEVSRSPEEFHALVRREGVTVLNQTPSAFRQFMNADADAAAEASDDVVLRYVIFGGEALDLESLRPWFERHGDECPRFVNMYGITETTVHVTYRPLGLADLNAAPGSVIGRPIPDLRVFVLDTHGQPCPIGVPGEMYVGGAGVARGYVARPALTAQRFVPDPYGDVPGARLYRTGDVARLLANGDLQYLGRNDEQVKVRGFRIELGEIEASLARHERVREAVVLVREDDPGNKRIVAYMVTGGDDGALASELRTFLAGQLPPYMVPAVFVPIESVPLTAHGKVDRRALPAPTGERASSDDGYVAPRTREEVALARIWAGLLRIERVGVYDNFFELGGDSILGIQVIARARDAGLVLAARHVFQHQTVGALAAAAGGTSVIAEQGPVVGELPLTPIQHWFFEQELADAHHFNQSLLLSIGIGLAASVGEQAVAALLAHHDALRLRFERSEAGWRQVNAEPGGDPQFECVDLSALAEDEQAAAIAAKARALQASLDLAEVPLVRVAMFDLGEDRPGRLLIVIHHLAVDGVSWRILREDLQRACESLIAGEPVQLPAKTTSFLDWARRIQAYAQGDDLMEELDHWLQLPWSDVGSVPPDHEGGDNAGQTLERVTAALTESETTALLQEVPEAYNTQINDVLLTALARTMASWTERDAVLIDLEGHGREDLFDDIDVSRTVGWFTTIFPVVLDLREREAAGRLEPGAALKSVKEQLRSIPYRGIGYGMLRYLTATESGADRLARLPQAQVIFNYLGQLDQVFDGDSMFGFANEPMGSAVSPRNRRPHLLEIDARVVGGQLQVSLTFSADIFDRATMDRFAAGFMESLRELIDHCRSKTDRDYTPSDFPIANLHEDELSQVADLLARLDETD